MLSTATPERCQGRGGSEDVRGARLGGDFPSWAFAILVRCSAKAFLAVLYFRGFITNVSELQCEFFQRSCVSRRTGVIDGGQGLLYQVVDS